MTDPEELKFHKLDKMLYDHGVKYAQRETVKENAKEFLKDESGLLSWSPEKGWYKLELPEHLNPVDQNTTEDDRKKFDTQKEEWHKEQQQDGKILLAKIVNDQTADRINKEILFMRVGIEEVLSEIKENPADVCISDIIDGLEKLLTGSYHAGERILLTRSNAMEILLAL